MAGTSPKHKAKIKKARKMLTRIEREKGTPVFQGGQWRFGAYMRQVRLNPLTREKYLEKKSLFEKMFKKAEKQNGKKEKISNS